MSISAAGPLATAAQKVGSSWRVLAIVGIAEVSAAFTIRDLTQTTG
jgi:hypothetical protein